MIVWILSRVAPRPFAAGFLALVVGLPFLLYSTVTHAPPEEKDLAQVSGTVGEVTTSCVGRGGCHRTGVVLDADGKRFSLGSGFCYLARDEMAPGDHVSAKYVRESSRQPTGVAFGITRGSDVLCRYQDAVAARKRLKDGGVDFGALATVFGLIAVAWSFLLGSKLGYAKQASGRATG